MRITLSLASLAEQSRQIPLLTRDMPMQIKRRGVEMRLVIEGPIPMPIRFSSGRLHVRMPGAKSCYPGTCHPLLPSHPAAESAIAM